MRFLLQISNTQTQRIPINYQYPLSAWIYRVFHTADRDFSHWLHNHGYAYNSHRKFKHFTFSNLKLKGASFQKYPRPHLEIPAGTHEIHLGFYLEEAAGKFITGLFNRQEMPIGNPDFHANFEVRQVERMPAPQFSGKTHFRTLSPVVVSTRQPHRGKKHPQYLSPTFPEYSRFLKENLLKRYVSAHSDQVAGLVQEGPRSEVLADLPFDPDHWDFELLSETKSKLIHFKEDSKIRAYLYSFRLDAPQELLEIAYSAGLGEKGSAGFGCIGMAESKNAPPKGNDRAEVNTNQA